MIYAIRQKLKKVPSSMRLKTFTWKLEALSPFFWTKRMSLWRYVSGWLYSHSCDWSVPRRVTTISLPKDGARKTKPHN